MRNLIIYKTGLWCMLLIIVSCSNEKIEIDNELKKTIEKYYLNQQNHNWDLTYEMRSPKFRKIVDKPYYKEQMSNDSKGWNLIKFDIQEAEKADDKVIVKIMFTYNINIENNKEKISRVQSFIEKTEWEKIHDNWYSYDAGYQHHLTLNDPIVRKIN